MKKVLNLIIAVTLAACIAVAAPRVLSAQESLAKFVPEDAVFFKSCTDMEKTWANVTASNFWKELTGLKVWDETGVRAGLEDFAKEFSERAKFELSTKNLMALFGKEIAIAARVQPGPTPKAEGCLLCRCNPKSLAEDIIQKLTNAIKEKSGEEGLFKTITYKGTKMTFVGPSEEAGLAVGLKWGFVDDVFVVGIGNISPRLEAIVDLAGGSGNSLADNARFKKIVSDTRLTTGRLGGYFYADLQKVGETFAAIDTGGLPMPAQAMFNALKQSFSVPFILGGTHYFERGIVAKMVSVPAGEVTDELMKLSLGTSPAPGASISYVPENTIGYVAANAMPDVEKIWPLLLKQWEKQGVMPALNMFLEQIESGLGIKLAEDVIPWVGSEFAVLLSDIDTKPGFPYPKFALMLRVKDKQKANAFLQKVASLIKEVPAETGFKFEKTPYQGYDLSSVTIALPIPLPIALTPSYGIVDDFLVISSSADLLKQMIDTSKGRGKDLASNAMFKALNMPAKTNNVGFCNWIRFLDAVKGIGAWAANFTQAQPAGEGVKAMVDGYIVPIANCLSALESLGFYQINEANATSATYIARVKDLPAR